MKNASDYNPSGQYKQVNRQFYRFSLPYIKDGSKILNLGSGPYFDFEKFVIKHRKVTFSSVDIYPAKKPKIIKNLYIKNVESKLTFKEKFDVITFFELIEHIDKTDMLLKNCYLNLKKGGYLIFSFPNLSSIYSRLELLFGYQPHILEVSNLRANFGMGIMGKTNNPSNKPIHHVRGITHKAMKELVNFHKFKIIKTIGYEYRLKGIFYKFPSLAPVNIFVLKK